MLQIFDNETNTLYTEFSIEIRSLSHIDQNYPLIKDDTKQHGRKK